jgi:hypothetical protein
MVIFSGNELFCTGGKKKRLRSPSGPEPRSDGFVRKLYGVMVSVTVSMYAPAVAFW